MGLKQYTDNQITAAVEEMGSQAAAAIHLGVNTRTLERRLARIRSEEIESGESREIPEGHVVKGTSTLYDAQTGEPKLEWVKTSLDQQARLEAIQNAVDSLTTVDKPKPSKATLPALLPRQWQSSRSLTPTSACTLGAKKLARITMSTRL